MFVDYVWDCVRYRGRASKVLDVASHVNGWFYFDIHYSPEINRLLPRSWASHIRPDAPLLESGWAEKAAHVVVRRCLKGPLAPADETGMQEAQQWQ
jgi:hypothetical protein